MGHRCTQKRFSLVFHLCKSVPHLWLKKSVFIGAPSVAILSSLLLSACDRSSSTSPSAPTPPPKLTDLRPITYFEDNCSRCHGPYGSFYGDTFAQKLSPAQLHKVVHEMAAGPGNAPIEGPELEAQVAYHRSLADKKPFIVLTEMKEEYGQHILHGEATPESQLDLVIDGTSISAKLEGHRWSAALPAPSALSRLRIRATKNNQETSLNQGHVHSHE